MGLQASPAVLHAALIGNMHMDDHLVLIDTKTKHWQYIPKNITDHLESFGLVINRRKSQLVQVQKLRYCGVFLDPTEATIKPVRCHTETSVQIIHLRPSEAYDITATKPSHIA